MLKEFKAKTLLGALSTVLTLSAVTAAETQKTHEDSNSLCSQQTHMTQQDPLLKATSDDVLMKLVNGQQEIKAAVRNALEEKILVEHKEVARMMQTLTLAGVEGQNVADVAFETFFLNTFQADFVTEYLKSNKPNKCKESYYSNRAGVNLEAEWGQDDINYAKRTFSGLPLNQWDQVINKIYNNNNLGLGNYAYVYAISQSQAAHGRGAAFFMQMKEYLESQKANYKYLVFGAK